MPLRWRKLLAPFQRPSRTRSSWQLVNSLVPYLGLWCLMVWSLPVSYWLTLALAVPAAGFLVRIFVIFHDCSHGSFFRSRRANHFWGHVTGLLTFTPFHQWRRDHSVHHASAGNLDKRGIGDIWTMTVEEYLAASPGRRLAYRLARNPFVLFLLAPLYLFLIQQRFARHGDGPRERRNVHATNAALLALGFLLCAGLGVKTYLLIQLPVVTLAGMAGVWLFYVQHQFEGAYWARRSDWDYAAAALQGSSFYRLPKLLQWFTGSIGFHHIHHLQPGIPNYHLERAHRADARFERVPSVGVRSSLRCLGYRLWDERRHRLVSFRQLRELGGAAGTSL